LLARPLLCGAQSVPPAESDPEASTFASQRVLKSERDAYRSVFDTSPVAMLLCEVGSLRVMAANQLAAKLHGASPEELQDVSLFALRRVSDLTSAMLKRAMGQELALGFGYHTRKDGSTFPVQLSIHPSELAGRPAWLCVLKSLDELLSPREGEQQRRMFEAIGRVAGGVAHDLNNLLSVILSFCNLATSQLPVASAAQADLSEIHGAADRATALTKQLLSLSRRAPASPKPLQLNGLIERMEKLLRRLLDEQLSLELELQPELDEVLADAAQVERLLLQLVSVARSPTEKGGRLVVETRNVELDAEHGSVRHVTLSVYDSQNSLASEIAALAPWVDSGNAWLETDPATGTRFVACFPSVTRQLSGSSDATTRPETVLVVQDNPHLRKTLKTYFAREGFRVLDAGGRLEALELIEQEPRIDLLLADFSLPDGSGPELGRELRERLPRLKLLIATGHPDQRAALREDERTAIISKPFDLQQFGALVQRLINAPDAAVR
jgi:two-component system, cell cycle sensor histidine kinase and response regulator CckA